MKSEKNENSLKFLKEKIINPNLAYDMDDEEEIYNHNFLNNEEDEENIEIKESNNIESSPNQAISQEKEKENKVSKDPIVLIPKATNNNSNILPQQLSSIKLVKCKIHNKDYLKLDKNNFEIICQKCIDNEKESQLIIINDFDSDEFKFNCYKHIESKGSFYCEDCKGFICKMCFAEEHRSHKCHLPEIIKNEFEQNIQESIDNSSKLSPILNNNINDIKKIYENIKKQKQDIMVIPQNTLKIISNNNDNEINSLRNKTYEKFFGLDKEVNENYVSFNIIKEKTKKYLEQLKAINDKINNKENDPKFDLCNYHREQSNLLNEILNYINSSFNFINIRINNTNNKFEENEEKIENALNLMNKEISNYEKICISSILTGRENRSIILRRYHHFSHNEIKYFKNTIIGFGADDNICLSGLSLCGLYISKRKMKPVINDNNTNENISKDGESNNEEIKKFIPIQITISTMINQIEGQKLFSQEFQLSTVKGSDDPAQIINFEKGVKMYKEKLYLIRVENLSNNNYIDIWTGSVKTRKKNIQIIKCNNTGIQFVFKQAQGIQTDFEEFENGIIEGILYSSYK